MGVEYVDRPTDDSNADTNYITLDLIDDLEA